MTAKEYLWQLWKIDKELDTKRDTLKNLKAQVGIKAQPDPNENVGHSGNVSDPVSDVAVRIVQMEKSIEETMLRLLDLKAKIIKQIDGLDNRNYRIVLTCRYVLMMKWNEIAETMDYDVRNCTILHGKALDAFAKKYLS